MDYKELGIKAFSRYKFKNAKLFFSLAYEQKPSNELLFLIELANIAMIDRNEAMLVFEFYQVQTKRKMGEFFKILESLEAKIYAKIDDDENISEDVKEELRNSISYKDFKEAAKERGGFKQALEGIMFSSSITIESKEEMLNFLENLVENDFIEMSLKYIEDFAWVFTDDLKFNKLVEKIKKNENSN